MRRIGRYILNTLTVLSLVLCVATVGLWVRSYFALTQVYWQPQQNSGDKTFRLSFGRGGVGLGAYWTDTGITTRAAGQLHVRSVVPATYPNGEGLRWVDVVPVVAGFGLRTHGESAFTEPRMVVSYWSAIAPIWPFACVFASLPAFYLLRRRRQGDRGVGRCSRCGYDLRATPDRCPECGTIPTKVKA